MEHKVLLCRSFPLKESPNNERAGCFFSLIDSISALIPYLNSLEKVFLWKGNLLLVVCAASFTRHIREWIVSCLHGSLCKGSLLTVF